MKRKFGVEHSKVNDNVSESKASPEIKESVEKVMKQRHEFALNAVWLRAQLSDLDDDTLNKNPADIAEEIVGADNMKTFSDDARQLFRDVAYKYILQRNKMKQEELRFGSELMNPYFHDVNVDGNNIMRKISEAQASTIYEALPPEYKKDAFTRDHVDPIREAIDHDYGYHDRLVVDEDTFNTIKRRYLELESDFTDTRIASEKKMAEIRRKGERITEEPELFGKELFMTATGEEPKGEVNLQNKGVFYLCVFSNGDDFDLFHEKPYEKKRTVSTLGMMQASFSVSNSISLPGPLATVKGSADRSDSKIIDTSVHEEQHVVNGIYLNHFSTEKVSNKVDRLARRHIKDEILARFSTGIHNDTEYVIQAIYGAHESQKQNPESYKCSYQEHLDNVDDKQEVQKDIVKIAQKLSALKEIFATPERAEILVSQLYDIPLDKFPMHLELMAKYYSKRQQEFEEAARSLKPIPDDIQKRITWATHLPESQRIIQALKTLTVTANGLFLEDAPLNQAVLTNQDVGTYSAKVEELKAEYSKLSAELEHTPSALHFPHLSSIEKEKSASATTLMHDTLGYLNSINKDEIAEMIEDAKLGSNTLPENIENAMNEIFETQDGEISFMRLSEKNDVLQIDIRYSTKDNKARCRFLIPNNQNEPRA